MDLRCDWIHICDFDAMHVETFLSGMRLENSQLRLAAPWVSAAGEAFFSLHTLFEWFGCALESTAVIRAGVVGDA